VTDKIAPHLWKPRHDYCLRPKVLRPYPEIASRCTQSRHDFAFSRNHTF